MLLKGAEDVNCQIFSMNSQLMDLNAMSSTRGAKSLFFHATSLPRTSMLLDNSGSCGWLNLERREGHGVSVGNMCSLPNL